MKKKAKKAGPVKKKDDAKADATSATDKASSTAQDDETTDGGADAAPDADLDADDSAVAVEKPSGHNRAPSISQQSRLRSSSFRKSMSGQGPSSPTLKSPISPAGETVDIYRKQVERIDELEKENKRLEAETEEAEARWRKMEDELQELRETNSDVAALKSTADDVEKLKADLAALQRQNAQLQSAASKQRASPSIGSSSKDLLAELSSKSTTIESLELEISNLNAKLATTQATGNDHASRATLLESQLEKAQLEAKSATLELADLKSNLEKASERAVLEGSSRSSAETRIAQLEAELGTANRKSTDSAKRVETLEKKIEAMTTLHREADARTTAKLTELQRHEREARELRSRVTSLGNETARLRDEALRRKKMDADGDSAGLDELEDEERAKLAARVRELEDEVFDLRRGVWRDKRRELQPGLDGGAAGAAAGFDDVDLSSGNTPTRRPEARSGGSTISDVINSGISAFTGGSRINGGLGLVEEDIDDGVDDDDDDDMEFDEDAFRLAQEEEARARLERVKEVKRGLKRWEGWRVDLADVRAGLGGVFDL
jgi:DNA repair exonuclease SbcCD ATPase subunit